MQKPPAPPKTKQNLAQRKETQPRAHLYQLKADNSPNQRNIKTLLRCDKGFKEAERDTEEPRTKGKHNRTKDSPYATTTGAPHTHRKTQRGCRLVRQHGFRRDARRYWETDSTPSRFQKRTQTKNTGVPKKEALEHGDVFTASGEHDFGKLSSASRGRGRNTCAQAGQQSVSCFSTQRRSPKAGLPLFLRA